MQPPRLLDSIRRLFAGLRLGRAELQSSRSVPQVVASRGDRAHAPNRRPDDEAPRRSLDSRPMPPRTAEGASISSRPMPVAPAAATAPSMPRTQAAAAPVAAVPVAAAPVATTPVAVQPAPEVAAAVAPVATTAIPAPLAAPLAASAPIAPAASETAAPAASSAAAAAAQAATPAKTMRSLDEVRADLARLRENARQRHAQLQVRRESSAFAPTDFMDFGRTPEPLPSEPAPLLPTRAADSGRPGDAGNADASEAEDGSDTSFAATAYLDFSTIKPKPGR